MSRHVVIVGASMGGLRAAEQLRSQGFDGDITLIGAEPHLPYNRPPLSKDVLAQHRDEANSDIDSWHQAVAFRQRKHTADVTWRLGQPVTSSDLAARTVTLADGTVMPFDGLVIATGLRPRRLALPGPTQGRLTDRPGDSAVFSPLPSFWSDQYDLRLQGYGSPGDANAIRVIEGAFDDSGDGPPAAGTVIGYYRDEALVGVVMISPTSTQNLHYRGVVDTTRAQLQPA